MKAIATARNDSQTMSGNQSGTAERPLVSVIVPGYNESTIIEKNQIGRAHV